MPLLPLLLLILILSLFPISGALSDLIVSEGILDSKVSLWEERKELKMKAGALGSGFLLE